jgi:DNA-binding transcriptional regulator LsrR (DeoR family)
MEPHEFTEIHEQGAVGYTCGWFFNEKARSLIARSMREL